MRASSRATRSLICPHCTPQAITLTSPSLSHSSRNAIRRFTSASLRTRPALNRDTTWLSQYTRGSGRSVGSTLVPKSLIASRSGLCYSSTIEVEAQIQAGESLKAPAAQDITLEAVPDPAFDLSVLPVSCTGCGALTQWLAPGEAGYYSTRKDVRKYIIAVKKGEAEIAKAEKDASVPAQAGVKALTEPSLAPPKAPLCDRCHDLVNYNKGISITHPSIGAIQDTMDESKSRNNHIYHVVDAADFPMSLIPSLYRDLNLRFQRSRNRRIRQGTRGGLATVSFVITKSDLLAPQGEQVNKMMPWVTSVLREALGQYGENVRLGNVHLVSSERGWWTKQIKEEIKERGGTNWLVGKVNVGKSSLFHNIFPKGSRPVAPVPVEPEGLEGTVRYNPFANLENEEQEKIEHDTNEEVNVLLPPLPQETPYPEMPIISTLAGTTASPIRHSFGNGKGEVIDLPGLARGDFEEHLKDEFRTDYMMTKRPKPTQLSLAPGKSLLLGNLVRLTPLDERHQFLFASFNKLPPHVTSTEKAIEFQEGRRELTIDSWAKPGTGATIASAGVFELKWDVTKQRGGSKAASFKDINSLPFQIFGADILIEGVGWVEVAVQVRRKKRQPEHTAEAGTLPTEMQDAANEFPQVEVFSPKGKYIAVRPPLGVWGLIERKPGRSKLKGRPRPSMKGQKKKLKHMARERRQAEASA